VTPEPSSLLEGDSHNLTNLRALLDNVDPHHFRGADVGFRIVQRIIRRVVFPDPFGPRITIISPSSTVKFRPRRASVFPYLFERLIVSTANKDTSSTQEMAIKMFERYSSNNRLGYL